MYVCMYDVYVDGVYTCKLPGRFVREPVAVSENPAERKAAWTAKATGS